MSDHTKFVAPRPTFIHTTNAAAIEAMAPRVRDNLPSLPVAERIAVEGHVNVADLLARAQAQAKENAKVIERNTAPRKPRVRKGETKDDTTIVRARVEPSPKFLPGDVVDDATFIKLTRGMTSSSPEAQRLFWANGGEAYLVGGLMYAQAFDNLRRAVQQRMRGSTTAGPAYTRIGHVPTGARVVTPGLPSQHDRDRQRAAHERAQRLTANRKWAGIEK